MIKFNVVSLLLMLLILMSSLFSMNAVAISIGVAPSEIRIAKALKGEEYERMILVFNGEDAEAVYTFEAKGEYADWVSFPSKMLTVPGNGKVKVPIKVRIPVDAANGEYVIPIEVRSLPAKTGKAKVGASVALSMTVTLRVEVVGEQILSGTVEGITVSSGEVKYPPVKIAIRFRNTGNVVARPTVKVDIADKKGNPIDSFTYSETSIKPGRRGLIQLEWDTSEVNPGDYQATITILLDGEVLAREEKAFTVFPYGTLTRKGLLTNLSYVGEPALEGTIKIMGKFKNIGLINTEAKLICEISCNGKLVDIVESEPLEVSVGEEETLVCYLKIGEPGDYTVKSYVVYDGKRTDSRELSFAVSKPMDTYPILIVTTLTIVVGFYVIWRRRRLRSEPENRTFRSKPLKVFSQRNRSGWE